MGDMYSKLGDLISDALEKGEIPEKKQIKENDDVNRQSGENVFSDEKIDDKRFSDEKNGVSGKNIGETEKISQENTQNFGEKTGKNKKRIHIFTKKSQISQGEVIKMHKYTENMYISPEILHALDTLDIAYPADLKMIKKQYHKLLKELHPDTKTTIQSSNNVENSRQNQKSIDEIQAAYNYLKTQYKK